jgi:hypothetical protein
LYFPKIKGISKLAIVAQNDRMGKECHSEYLSDVMDREWALLAPYLALRQGDSKRLEHKLCAVSNDPRHIVRSGCQR